MQIAEHIERQLLASLGHLREVEEFQAAGRFPDEVVGREQSRIRQPVVHQPEFSVRLAALEGMIVALEADQFDIFAVHEAPGQFGQWRDVTRRIVDEQDPVDSAVGERQVVAQCVKIVVQAVGRVKARNRRHRRQQRSGHQKAGGFVR